MQSEAVWPSFLFVVGEQQSRCVSPVRLGLKRNFSSLFQRPDDLGLAHVNGFHLLHIH